jgi:hypothetical protein
LIPAQSKSPPFEQKSFCMSTTTTAVCEILILIGSGLPSMVVCDSLVSPICGPGAVPFAYGVALKML